MQVPLTLEVALSLLDQRTSIADVMAQAHPPAVKSPKALVKEARLAKGLCIRPGCPKRHLEGKKLCGPHLKAMLKGR